MSEIEVHAVTQGDPGLLGALAAVWAAADREINPDDPPAPREEVAAELFVESIAVRRCGWVAHVDGEPAGILVVSFDQTGENDHVVDVETLAVLPGHRRRGVADALLRVGLEAAAADGRSSVVLWVPDLPGAAGQRYAERCGTTLRLHERCSRLAVADLDAEQQADWLRAERARSEGYRLVQWVDALPDEHLDVLLAAHRAMEDMPTDDLEWNIPPMTTERLRSRDASWIAGGRRNVCTLAIAPDGSAAGLSELQLNTHRPELGEQGDTGVVEAHRGHGLGRWLKAANLQLAREAEPRIRVVQTYNAESNPWMLAINVAMGFRPHVAYLAHQGDVARAREVVG